MSTLTVLFSLTLTLASPALAAAETQQAPPRPAPAPVEVAVPSDYLIGPQDVLGVILWREPEFSGDVTVRPDGKVTLPLMGEIQAAGLTPLALRKVILTEAVKYFMEPNVQVVVRSIQSRKVFVTGRVTTPGTHALVGPLTVMQALALSGGVTEYADAKNITILRNEGGAVRTLKFNYRDVSKGKNLQQNILLIPGDTVVVP
jgi:polysaccharide export outer membrane protein